DAPPTAAERVSSLQMSLFTALVQTAQTVRDEEAIGLLREALSYQPADTNARLMLVRKLVTLRQFDDARHEIDPIVSGPEFDNPEVQSLLAEMDAGRGRYQEAIVRYDRLARRTKDPRYQQRLDEIKSD